MAELSMRTKDRLRSNETVEMVFIEPKGYVKRANLPTGKGVNDNSGVIFWINRGWQVASKYDADQHRLKVEAEQRAAEEAAKAATLEVEAEPKKAAKAGK